MRCYGVEYAAPCSARYTMQCALCMRRYGSMRRHTARAKPVRVAFNSPGFHEIDGMALVKRWKADGHMKPVGRDEGCESSAGKGGAGAQGAGAQGELPAGLRCVV